jgi:hypothetical protein
MRDTRRQREIIAVLLTAGIGAVIGELYIKPLLTRNLGVKR